MKAIEDVKPYNQKDKDGLVNGLYLWGYETGDVQFAFMIKDIPEGEFIEFEYDIYDELPWGV